MECAIHKTCLSGLCNPNALDWIAQSTTEAASMEMDSKPTDDERAGLSWRNGMEEAGRHYWMQQAGNTGRATDTWAAFSRAASYGPREDA
ncbi:MAG: hypothetical protein V3Q69_13885 (plasmid) [Burkholderia sp.]